MPTHILVRNPKNGFEGLYRSSDGVRIALAKKADNNRGYKFQVLDELHPDNLRATGIKNRLKPMYFKDLYCARGMLTALAQADARRAGIADSEIEEREESPDLDKENAK